MHLEGILPRGRNIWQYFVLKWKNVFSMEKKNWGTAKEEEEYMLHFRERNYLFFDSHFGWDFAFKHRRTNERRCFRYLEILTKSGFKWNVFQHWYILLNVAGDTSAWTYGRYSFRKIKKAVSVHRMLLCCSMSPCDVLTSDFVWVNMPESFFMEAHIVVSSQLHSHMDSQSETTMETIL